MSEDDLKKANRESLTGSEMEVKPVWKQLQVLDK